MNTALITAASCAGLAALVSACLTRFLCRPTSSLYILDYPNERSLHSRPTPRTGGIAIVTAVFVAGAIWILYIGDSSKSAWLALAVALVAVASFIDDRRSIEPHYRLVVHFAAACLVVYGGFTFASSPAIALDFPAAAHAAAAVVFLVWMLELYNFMDGIDGFAGGMAVAGFGTLALLSASGGAPLVAGICVVIAAAALGFLLFNFPPARIFMGDVGSAPLGLLAGAMSLWGAQSGAYPFWAGILVFSPFIVDATITLARRIGRREQFWRPHKTHYYQRLVQLGWSHRRVALSEYALMAGVSASAVWGSRQPAGVQQALLATWGLVYAALAWTIHALETSARDRFAAKPTMADPSKTS